MAKRSWSVIEIIQAARMWIIKHGRPPTYRDWRSPGPDHPSCSTVERQIGGMKQLRVLLGYTARTRRWTNDEMIQWARTEHALGLAVNYAATAQRYRSPDQPDAPVYADICLEFRSLPEFRQIAGINSTTSLADSQQKAIQALHEFHTKHGRVPTTTEWRCLPNCDGPWHPTADQVRKLFCSWNQYLQQAGYEADRSGSVPTRRRRWIHRKEEMIDALRRFYDEHGRVPTTTDFTTATDTTPCYVTYMNVFREEAAATGETAWDHALRLAGLTAPTKHTIARPRAFRSLGDAVTRYWFGFFVADGCIDHFNRVRFKQSTANGHDQAVARIRAFFGSTHAITRVTDTSMHNGTNADRVSHEFVCKEMVKDLMHHGLRPNKTGTEAGFPLTIDNAAALMGYYDGDGSINSQTGLVRFIVPKESVSTMLSLLIRLVPGCTTRTHSTYSKRQAFVDVTGRSRAQLLRVMYGSVRGAVRTLDRKREQAELLVGSIEGEPCPDFS